MDQILAKANFGARWSGLGWKEQSTHMCMEHGSFWMNCFEEQWNKWENVKIKEGMMANQLHNFIWLWMNYNFILLNCNVWIT